MKKKILNNINGFLKRIDIKKIRFNPKQYMKTNVLFFSFIATSMINVTLLRFITIKNFFELQPILGDLAFVIIIGAIGYLFKPNHQFKYFFTLAIIVTALCIINSMYYTNYLSFASVSLLATSFQIVDVGDAVVQNVMEIKDFCYLWQIFALFFINKTLKQKNYYEKAGKIEIGKLRAFNTLIVGGIIFAVFTTTLTSLDLGRLRKQWNREYIVSRFGIFAYQFNDIASSVSTQITPLFGYDNAAKEFREYYLEKSLVEKEDNQYTNIFKGKNVLFIHAESMQTFAMEASFNGEEVTPNLNRLAKEGMFFSNFYAQESVGTSSDSEFTLSSSLLPTSSGTVFVNYFDREYVTIQKLFRDQGYYTFSMHGNKCAFWNRNVVHDKLGYNRFYCYTNDYKIDEVIGLGLSDKSFFKQSVDKIKKVNDTYNNYYGTIIMLTNHTPFSDVKKMDDFPVDFKYEKVNEETGETEIISAPYMEGTMLGNYFKSVHYADQAIGQLINDLDDNGLLDNTVIVIYGDHDAKLKTREFLRYYNYDPYTDSVISKNDPTYKRMDSFDYELNRKVPFIIWTKDKQYNVKVDEVMGMYDILPTVGNMFGVKSDYALGNDMFSVQENIVVFPDGDWLTNKMYYNSQKEEGRLLDPNYSVSIEYIQKNIDYADKLISISDNIIIHDLIRKTKENAALMNGE
ncbi:MAG TPA: LTA synthase family protein [Tenericutes bacterium]|nr:LTA synthase family protein [Mycoplasmatota bacterium]